MGIPTLIYCAAYDFAFARLAVAAGWSYGARLPGWVHPSLAGSVHFADQDWKAPRRRDYMLALRHYMPHTATVLDLEKEGQLDEVLGWTEEAARWVWRVVIVPKVCGVIEHLPRRVGRTEVVLGYSVPTSYGGTDVPVEEFGGWPVHLLGGSPQRQMALARSLDVVSLDNSMIQQQANRCRFWDAAKPLGSPWVQLRDSGGAGVGAGANLECFRRSVANIREAWRWVGHAPPQDAAPTPTSIL